MVDPPTSPESSVLSETEASEIPTTSWQGALVTALYCGLCFTIYAGLLLVNDYESEDTLSKFGYLSADRIWDGAYSGLITSAAVHFEWWHVCFNAYWLWVLGSRLERAIGSGRYLAFLLAAAVISSSYQLAVSDTTGIGASGVVYAIYGFMWVARDRYPEFRRVLPGKVIQLFNSWLVVCFLLTVLDILQVGNASHVTGLLFGCGIGGIVIRSRVWKLAVVGLAGLACGAIIPLFWSPWSIAWQGHQGYRAQLEERYRDALGYYNTVIERDPTSAWAYYNRSGVHVMLQNPIQSADDMRQAIQLNPAYRELAAEQPQNDDSTNAP